MENLHFGIIGGTGRLGTVIKSLCKGSSSISSATKQGEIDFENIDIFIDVSGPDIITNYIDAIIKHKKPLVIGSTGHSEQTNILLEKANKLIPILIAPNFSKGIVLIKRILKEIPLSPEKIIETHHVNKKDTPSGTATLLSSLFSPPPQIESIRKENAIGTHKIRYKLEGEEIEIIHRAESLHLFANGAIAAATFLSKKEKGIYTMEDVYL